MSYCRFSSMSGRCDLYLYHSVGDYWALHVATNRPPEGRPQSGFEAMYDLIKSKFAGQMNAQEVYDEAEEVQDAWDELNPAQPIDHPEAGKTYRFSEPGEVADWLEADGKGLVFPSDLIEDLRFEQQEMDAEQSDDPL